MEPGRGYWGSLNPHHSIPFWRLGKFSFAKGRFVEQIGVIKAPQPFMIDANAILVGKACAHIRFCPAMEKRLDAYGRQEDAGTNGQAIAPFQAGAIGLCLAASGKVAQMLESIIPFPVEAAFDRLGVFPFGMDLEKGLHCFRLGPVPTAMDFLTLRKRELYTLTHRHCHVDSEMRHSRQD